MALAAKINRKNYHVYTLVGDGECDEGTIWETAMLAAQHHLENFTIVVDHNHMQAMGRCDDVLQIDPLGERWRVFGWNVVEVQDGNDHNQLKTAFCAPTYGQPKCIIANTVKGKGISFMENELLWHYRDPQGEFYDRAVEELEAAKK